MTFNFIRLKNMINETVARPWDKKDKESWFKQQTIKRSYKEEVVTKINKLRDNFDILEYGSLSLDPIKYPIFLIKTKNFDNNKRTVLITGGVHGYETSGVHGALLFFETHVTRYLNDFNFICAPCISPWSYETINRWNHLAIDPNRSFYQNSPADECKLFLDIMSSQNINPYVHFDLHETTDTDNTIFRIALEQRDAVTNIFSEIPDGFYVVGDSQNPQLNFQSAVIDSVKKITHIAPADEKEMLIGVPVESEGVVNYDMKKLFLCGGFSNAKFTTTTEVYPDSPKVTDDICSLAQVAAICGGLDYILNL